jgi:hypothetical protein
MGVESVLIRCRRGLPSVRGGTVVLYPLAKYQPEVKPLYGKRVHVVIIAEE